MDLYSAQSSGRLWSVVVLGLLGFFVECPARKVCAQTRGKPQQVAVEGCVARDVHSRHFLIHTDLSLGKANDLLERLEAMLVPMAAYWGQPLHGTIECYVIRNLDEFPAVAVAPAGVHAVRTFGGMTLMEAKKEGKRQVAKSIVYSSARLRSRPARSGSCLLPSDLWPPRAGLVFRGDGRNGPLLEGGRHRGPRRAARNRVSPQQPAQIARRDPFARPGHRRLLAELRLALGALPFSGPRIPTTRRSSGSLAADILAGKDVSFEQTYARDDATSCASSIFSSSSTSAGATAWTCVPGTGRRSSPACSPDECRTATIAAGRGWQPTGLTVRSGTHYEYLAAGTWQIAGRPEAVDANGDDQGRGRLVGVLMKDYRLGAEFELGAKGSLQLDADGDLYLRCRNAWNELADDSGHVTRQASKLPGQTVPRRLGRCALPPLSGQ